MVKRYKTTRHKRYKKKRTITRKKVVGGTKSQERKKSAMRLALLAMVMAGNPGEADDVVKEMYVNKPNINVQDTRASHVSNVPRVRHEVNIGNKSEARSRRSQSQSQRKGR